MGQPAERQEWERHWKSTSVSAFLLERLSTLVRRQILSRAVRHYTNLFFPPVGLFVECGCGTAQSSARIDRNGRRLVALDFSASALGKVTGSLPFTALVQGDIRELPFANDSVAGIWNLGVMEHFDTTSAQAILAEFRRVLKPGGTAILFWPPEFGSSRWILAPVEWLISKARGRPWRVFPDELNRLRSRRHAAETLRGVGLVPAAIEFTPRDAFVHVVVVARKSA